MAITMKIYQYNGDHRVLDKQLPAGTQISGTFRDAVDIMRPTVLVERTAVTGNYIHIGAPVNRYYYIDDITQDRTGLQLLHLREDVLMTHKDKINKLPGVVERSDTFFNADLPDPEVQRLQRTQAYTRTIGSAFSYDSRYVLITVG